VVDLLIDILILILFIILLIINVRVKEVSKFTVITLIVAFIAETLVRILKQI